MEATKKNISRKRVGFIVQESGILRHGVEIVDGQGNKVGVVTSGSYCPTVNKAIGMAYVKPSVAKVNLGFQFLTL